MCFWIFLPYFFSCRMLLHGFCLYWFVEFFNYSATDPSAALHCVWMWFAFFFFLCFFFFLDVFFFKHLFFYHMYECFLDSCLCTTRAPGALGGQKRTPDSLKLEFNMDMSHHVVLRIEPRSFTRAASALSHQAICPALLGRVS